MTKAIWGLFIVVLVHCADLHASSVTATQNGNWNMTDTWGGNAVPGCYDTIVIPAGITVTVTSTVNLTGCPPVYILVQGTLHFQSGKKLDLPNGSVVYIAPGGAITGGGGGGNSNWITIAGTAYWTAGDGNLSGPAILCQSCSLPIELISFTANLNAGIVHLDWVTASEEGNDYFMVQRSADGFSWEDVVMVDGANNSSTTLYYHEEDRAPYMGLSYYRLKQVDMNGAYSYSDVKAVSNGQFFSDQQLLIVSGSSGSQQNVVIYFSESIDGEVTVYFTSMSGTVVCSRTYLLSSEKWVVLPLDYALSTGIYVLKADQLIERVFLE